MAGDPPSSSPGSLAGGRYLLIEEVGRGGMARVFRAMDTQLRVERAIKIIHTEGRGASGRARRLATEAQAMARIHHAHILAVHDIGESEEGPFVVMDLVRGGNLEEHLEKFGPIPPRQAVLWMIEVLEALEAAHAVGVIHRDIKPSNILLDSSGSTKLADFGIAMFTDGLDRHTRTGVTMGSMAYMAPEQRLDARSVNASADVYAAACTLYNLLTLATPVDLFTATPESPRWMDLPRRLREVLYRATRLDPAARFRTAGSFAETLRLVQAELDGLPPVPVRAGLPSSDGNTVAALPGELSGDLPTMARETLEDEERRVPWWLVATALLGAGVTSPLWLGSIFATSAPVPPQDQVSTVVDAVLPPTGREVSVVEAMIPAATPTPSAAAQPHQPTRVPVESTPAVPTPAVLAPVRPIVELTEPPGSSEEVRPVARTMANDAVAGHWRGSFNGMPCTMHLRLEGARLEGTTSTSFGGGEPQETRVAGGFEGSTLVLNDLEDVPDAGRYDLALGPVGDRLQGTFSTRDARTLPVSFRRSAGADGGTRGP